MATATTGIRTRTLATATATVPTTATGTGTRLRSSRPHRSGAEVGRRPRRTHQLSQVAGCIIEINPTHFIAILRNRVYAERSGGSMSTTEKTIRALTEREYQYGFV